MSVKESSLFALASVYRVPMMAKVSVKGDDKTPLYQYLTASPNVGGEIKWSFHQVPYRAQRTADRSV